VASRAMMVSQKAPPSRLSVKLRIVVVVAVVVAVSCCSPGRRSGSPNALTRKRSFVARARPSAVRRQLAPYGGRSWKSPHDAARCHFPPVSDVKCPGLSLTRQATVRTDGSVVVSCILRQLCYAHRAFAIRLPITTLTSHRTSSPNATHDVSLLTMTFTSRHSSFNNPTFCEI